MNPLLSELILTETEQCFLFPYAVNKLKNLELSQHPNAVTVARVGLFLARLTW
jgi:hypothetical protein